MHPDLAPHLHTPECNELIAQYHKCHAEHPFLKFTGYCNELDNLMIKCMKKERLARREKNFKQSKQEQERIRKGLPREQST